MPLSSPPVRSRARARARARARFLLLPLLAMALPACDPPDLTPASEVIRLRVLAIETEPPEIAFGETVQLTPVIADPWDEGYSPQWMPCIETSLGGFAACDFDNMLVDISDPFALAGLTAERLEFTVDQPVVAELMADMDALDRADGLSLQFILMLFPRGKTILDYMPEFDFEQIDDPDYLEQYGEQTSEAFNTVFEALMRQSRIAFKRVIVSDLESVGLDLHVDGECADLAGLLPNQAPRLGGVAHVEEDSEQTYPSGVTIQVPVGETAALEPLWNPDDQETYYHVDWGGVTDCRSEQPFFGWFATGGSFSDRDGFPADNSFLDELGFPDPVQWQAPGEIPDRNPVDAWIVVWDRRGGIHHVELKLDVVEEAEE